jgi:hypothetical protein
LKKKISLEEKQQILRNKNVIKKLKVKFYLKLKKVKPEKSKKIFTDVMRRSGSPVIRNK